MNKFLNSKIGLLLLGFVLTTVFGAIIANVQSHTTWKRDKRFELLKQLLDRHEELRAELSRVTGARAFETERVLYALEPPMEPYQNDHERGERIKKAWDAYYATVVDWNRDYRRHVARIRHLAGIDVAQRFYISDEESKSPETKTLCGHFVRTHHALRRFKAAPYQPDDPHWQELHGSARKAIDQLYHHIDEFLLHLFAALDDRVKSENPLKKS